MELFVEVADSLASSGGSAPNPRPVNAGGPSGSRHQREIDVPQVASPSFDFNLQAEAATGGTELGDSRSFGVPEPDGAIPRPLEHAAVPATSIESQLGRSIWSRSGASGSSNGARASQGSNIPAEFVVGQSFHTKEEAVLAMKNYNIRRGVEYRVMEYDHAKYLDKCKEYGKGCT
ncbi:hypothetical protein PIB30_051237 [Stylosanthes scabra]|uniref:Transposase MuDR plant domain-containing protein n=1 Tax=Stylosanthes scabra TaxID=79078 RepID=A0ABU6WFY5_9FABA|nr:hypothetical protein [Stylosanthes scabra]